MWKEVEVVSLKTWQIALGQYEGEWDVESNLVAKKG